MIDKESPNLDRGHLREDAGALHNVAKKAYGFNCGMNRGRRGGSILSIDLSMS